MLYQTGDLVYAFAFTRFAVVVWKDYFLGNAYYRLAWIPRRDTAYDAWGGQIFGAAVTFGGLIAIPER